MERIRYVAMFLMIWAGFQANAWELPPRADGVEIRSYLEVWEDPAGTALLGDAKAQHEQGAFTHTDGNIDHGFSTSAFWFYLKIENLEGKERDLILENGYPIIDQIDIYCESDQNNNSYYRLGDHTHKSGRMLDINRISVFFSIAADEVMDCFFRVESTSNISLQIAIYDTNDYIEVFHQRQWLFGAFYGLCFGVFLVCLALFFYYGDSVFVYFGIHVLCVGLINISLDRSAFSFWAMLGLQDFMVLMLSSFSVMAHAQFMIRYLNLRSFCHWLVKGINAYTGIMAVALLLYPVLPIPLATQFILGFGVVYALVVFIVSIVGLRARFIPALLVIIAWLPLTIMIAFASVNIYVAPSDSSWYLYADKFGWSFQIVTTLAGLFYLIRHDLYRNKRSSSGNNVKRVGNVVAVKQLSSEVRTASQAIMDSIDRLDETVLNGSQVRQIEMLRSTAQGLMETGRDFQESANLEAGTISLQDEDVDLVLLARECGVSSEGAARRSGLQLLAIISAGVPVVVKTDPIRLKHIVRSLMNNAIRHTEIGYVKLKIDLTDEIVDKRIILSFKIEYTRSSAQNLPNTFKDEQILANSEQLISLMGGKMRFENHVTHGSRYVITLPVDVDQNVECLPTDQNLDFINGSAL